MSAAERIRRCRDVHGLTQAQLAKRVGVSARAVQAWEAGTRSPGPRSRVELGRVFDRQPAYFGGRA